MLIGVFARILGNALALEGTENACGPVVCLEVGALVAKLVLQVTQGVFLRLESVACLGNGLGF